jgi:hypothetical protein
MINENKIVNQEYKLNTAIMKLMKSFPVILSLLLFVGAQSYASSTFTGEDEVVDTINYTIYTGKIVDANDKTPLPFANIESEGVHLATVSNIDGEFTLKVPKDAQVTMIKVSYVGYKNQEVLLKNLRIQKMSSFYWNLHP